MSVSLCPSESSRQQGEGAGVAQSVQRPPAQVTISAYFPSSEIGQLESKTGGAVPSALHFLPFSRLFPTPQFKSLLLLVCLCVTVVIYCAKQRRPVRRTDVPRKGTRSFPRIVSIMTGLELFLSCADPGHHLLFPPK